MDYPGLWHFLPGKAASRLADSIAQDAGIVALRCICDCDRHYISAVQTANSRDTSRALLASATQSFTAGQTQKPAAAGNSAGSAPDHPLQPG